MNRTVSLFGLAAALIGLVSSAPALAQSTPIAQSPSPVAPAYQYPFQNPNLPAEDRITNLLSLMTVDEKIACLETNTSVPRLGIAGTNHIEGLHGLQMGGPRIQDMIRQFGERPASPGAKTVPGRAGGFRFTPSDTTSFPQEIGLGETWDPAILTKAGAVEGFEARYVAQKTHRGGLIVMAPNADLGRDPRWGRTEECYGEDPYFNGTMVTAYVKGLQGDNPRYWLSAALLKHFLANSNEDNRAASSSNFDDRLLREYYTVPFRMGIIDGGARAFMAAYNAYNGIPCGTSPILKDIAVDEWGENGIICTDGGALNLMVVAHHYYPDLPHAVAGSLKAGITKYLERPQKPVRDALDQGLITVADLDRAIRPNFRILIKLGLLDPPGLSPYSHIGEGPEPWRDPKNQALVRKVTDESIVLLKNEKQILPLDRSTVRSIAVIGPRADRVLFDWYGGQPPYAVSPLDGIRAKVGPNTIVRYAADNDGNQAARLARMSDVAVVCVGNHPDGGDNMPWATVQYPSEGREGIDRKSIDLEQESLIKQVYAANPRTVVVLISSFPYAINWTQAHVPAIVHMTHCSEEEGNALADVIFGDYNPAGRLVETWPSSLTQVPPMMDYNIRHGRTYMYFPYKPLYPFGYGLSYTAFAYSDLRISKSALSAQGNETVAVDVTNTGKRDGDEVVQMYAQYLNSAVSRPKEQLVGFRRIAIPAGQMRTVSLPLQAGQLAYWNVARHQFVVESGRPVRILIGRSSADIVASTVVHVTPSRMCRKGVQLGHGRSR